MKFGTILITNPTTLLHINKLSKISNIICCYDFISNRKTLNESLNKHLKSLNYLNTSINQKLKIVYSVLGTFEISKPEYKEIEDIDELILDRINYWDDMDDLDEDECYKLVKLGGKRVFVEEDFDYDELVEEIRDEIEKEIEDQPFYKIDLNYPQLISPEENIDNEYISLENIENAEYFDDNYIEKYFSSFIIILLTKAGYKIPFANLELNPDKLINGLHNIFTPAEFKLILLKALLKENTL